MQYDAWLLLVCVAISKIRWVSSSWSAERSHSGRDGVNLGFVLICGGTTTLALGTSSVRVSGCVNMLSRIAACLNSRIAPCGGDITLEPSGCMLTLECMMTSGASKNESEEGSLAWPVVAKSGIDDVCLDLSFNFGGATRLALVTCSDMVSGSINMLSRNAAHLAA